ncbi:hypothetical protein GCM10010228_42530 [Streptomyces massasporeus]|nr:hypothetical protein GCM10010228_42530 [Streptomyces massasporeus]
MLGPALENQQGEEEGEGEGEEEPVGSGVAGLFVAGSGSALGRGGGQGASPPPGSGHRPTPARCAGPLLHTLLWNVRVWTEAVLAVVRRELHMGRECSFGGVGVGVER